MKDAIPPQLRRGQTLSLCRCFAADAAIKVLPWPSGRREPKGQQNLCPAALRRGVFCSSSKMRIYTSTNTAKVLYPLTHRQVAFGRLYQRVQFNLLFTWLVLLPLDGRLLYTHPGSPKCDTLPQKTCFQGKSHGLIRPNN